MSDDMTPEEAAKVVENLIGQARERVWNKMEHGLYRIIRLPWWKRMFMAKQIACESLGCGPYWSGTPGVGNSISPKNLWEYFLGYGHSRKK